MDNKEFIVVFDFDGTITTRDTFLDFIFFACGWKKLFFGGLKSLSVLIWYFFQTVFFKNMAVADIVKEKIFTVFFGGIFKDKFDQFCDNYAVERLPEILRREALEKIQWHKERGHKLIIVSASMEDWIRPWALKNGFGKVIATILEARDGLVTGRFLGKNCNREEKVKRFLAEYPNRNNYYLYVYGDSYKDQQLFDIANEKFYRKFL